MKEVAEFSLLAHPVGTVGSGAAQLLFLLHGFHLALSEASRPRARGGVQVGSDRGMLGTGKGPHGKVGWVLLTGEEPAWQDLHSGPWEWRSPA